jgi:two-component system chemotaxis response regulator CheY
MPQKVLIVDDEPYMHALLRHHLVRAGFEVLNAENGREGVEVAALEIPAAIIMDVMMDQMDGLAALKQLKALDDTKKIPVVMITANAHHVTRELAESAGASLFLTKPFSPTKLMLEIRKLTQPAGG